MTKRSLIIADRLSGMTVPELAAKYGRTPGGIQTDLNRWGIRLPDEIRIRNQSRGITGLVRPAEVWPDCPPEKQEDYETLRKFYTAREAKAMLEVV